MTDMGASELRELATRYREGDGVEKDPVKAAELLGKASALGDPQAASSLGYMLMVGEGVPMDMAEAERQLRRAASGGVTAAMCNLGVILSESDPEESLGWFERAADLGNLKAVRNLAASYSSGCGASLDKARAAEYYRRAADMRDVDSMCVLASMLRNGDGVPMDSRPMLWGWMQSTSFPGSTDQSTRWGSSPRGRGCSTRMPSISSRPLRVRIREISSSSPTWAGSRYSSQ